MSEDDYAYDVEDAIIDELRRAGKSCLNCDHDATGCPGPAVSGVCENHIQVTDSKQCPKCGGEMEYVDCTPIDTYPYSRPSHPGDWWVCKCGHEEKV